jgi:group II intron reverse transcriptase/maturase
MRNAETLLNIIQDRGRRKLPVENVYRQLYNPDLYLRAYGRLQSNVGALTRGITAETVDGMSQQRITDIIEALRLEKWQWTPVRRVEIPKSNGKLRPLGIPTWSDKLLQEVLRSILEAYYEPLFSSASHGFRPRRGCHSALNQIHKNWVGTKWFIEGDIKGCFDNIDHTILMDTLRQSFHDNRLLRLIEGLLKAGYCQEWVYHPTYSGTPQGGVISPILSNIYLDRLDQYVEGTLIPLYTRGLRRKPHAEYRRIQSLSTYYRSVGRPKIAEELRRQMQVYPSQDPDDPDYRRLVYVRYADDFLLGLSGPRVEAEEIKERLAAFLFQELKLTLATEKTLITHAQTGKARFLGYDIAVMASQTKFDRQRKRTVNGKIGLYIPKEVMESKISRYMKEGKVIHRAELINDSEYDIVALYQQELRGLVQYYGGALNVGSLCKVRWVMETSLLKTLAHKGKSTVSQVKARYTGITQTPHGPRTCIKIIIPREGKQPLVATYGGLTLKRRPLATIREEKAIPAFTRFRSEIVDRLLRDTCEVCGADGRVEVHHIRKLADLRSKGQREKPLWMRIMSARQRKTLVVCKACHMDIQWNRPRART